MKKFIIAALAFAPALASAQQLTGIENIVTSIGRIVDLALPIVAALALLAFFWGLMKFIFATSNTDAKEDGKRIMIWGIIALFVMVSVWGLVQFIGTALNVDQGGTAPLPQPPQ